MHARTNALGMRNTFSEHPGRSSGYDLAPQVNEADLVLFLAGFYGPIFTLNVRSGESYYRRHSSRAKESKLATVRSSFRSARAEEVVDYVIKAYIGPGRDERQ